MSLSQLKISWREGLVSGIFDVDEFNCYIFLSNEECSGEGSGEFQHKSPQALGLRNDGLGSPEFLEQEPQILRKEKKLLSPVRHNICAESISTDCCEVCCITAWDLLLMNPGVYEQRHEPGQRSLYNVLKAYSVYDRDVGYVKGMGFIAGLLLFYVSEKDAFWLLVALLNGAVHAPMGGLYLARLPLVQQYLFQFDNLVKEQLPKLGEHFAQEMINPSMV